MTHGYVWLPIDFWNPKGQMIMAEAWSDGYLDGMGRGLFCSRPGLDLAIEATVMLAGSPFLYDPEAKKLEAKEGDCLAESILDIIGDSADASEEELAATKKVEKVIEALEGMRMEEARESPFAKIPLERKLEMELGGNASVSGHEEAWDAFAEGMRRLQRDEAAAMLADHLVFGKKDEKKRVEHGSVSYFWDGERFWTHLSSEPAGKGLGIAPLSMVLAALGDTRGSLGNVPAYLGEASGEDLEDLGLLADKVEGRGGSLRMFFRGDADSLRALESLRERKLLSQAGLERGLAAGPRRGM